MYSFINYLLIYFTATMFKATGDLSLDDVKRFLANCPKLRIINFERSKLEGKERKGSGRRRR